MLCGFVIGGPAGQNDKDRASWFGCAGEPNTLAWVCYSTMHLLQLQQKKYSSEQIWSAEHSLCSHCSTKCTEREQIKIKKGSRQKGSRGHHGPNRLYWSISHFYQLTAKSSYVFWQNNILFNLTFYCLRIQASLGWFGFSETGRLATSMEFLLDLG